MIRIILSINKTVFHKGPNTDIMSGLLGIPGALTSKEKKVHTFLNEFIVNIHAHTSGTIYNSIYFMSIS